MSIAPLTSIKPLASLGNDATVIYVNLTAKRKRENIRSSIFTLDFLASLHFPRFLWTRFETAICAPRRVAPFAEIQKLLPYPLVGRGKIPRTLSKYVQDWPLQRSAMRQWRN